MMAEERKPIAERVTREIVGGIRGAGDIANAVVDTVSESLVKLIKGTGTAGTTLTPTLADVVRGAIQGASQIGGDVGTAAKGAAVGVLRGTKEVGVYGVPTRAPSPRVGSRRGITKLAAIEPTATIGLCAKPELKAVAEEVETILDRIMAEAVE
jgi:hypothetical protein